MTINYRWFCFLPVLDFFWFQISHAFFARIGMNPLGGNTVFVRRATENRWAVCGRVLLDRRCDLVSAGVSRMPAAHNYADEYVTRRRATYHEQVIKQRTRWNQGLIQIS